MQAKAQSSQNYPSRNFNKNLNKTVDDLTNFAHAMPRTAQFFISRGGMAWLCSS